MFFTAAATLLVAACGSGSQEEATEAVEVVARSSAVSEVVSPPDYDGYPGDLLALTNFGVMDVLMRYDSFEQARDWTDAAVLATLQRVSVERPRGSDPRFPTFVSGRLRVEFSVDRQLGGREEVRTGDDGQLVVGLPLEADAELTAEVLARLEGLYGKAQYLLFLNRAIPPNEREVWYGIDFPTAPEGMLAVWPRDGRLSPVEPPNDLFADAVKRGEAKTGMLDTEVPSTAPEFEGPKPIGLHVADLEREFAAPIGTPRTPEPLGWDAHQRATAFLYEDASEG